MTSPNEHPNTPQNDNGHTTGEQPMETTQAMPAQASPMQQTQTMPTMQQQMPHIPGQVFPQTVDEVYAAIKNMLAHSASFSLTMADDVAKTVLFSSKGAGATVTARVTPAQQGTLVQFVSADPANPGAAMESTMFFGDVMRQLMGAQAAPNQRKRQAKGNAWVFYVSLAAIIVSVLALILLIVLTPRTGPWLVWVLGGVSIILSGFALYASLALDKAVINRILSGVAAGISVVALIFGFINAPKYSSHSDTQTSGSSQSSTGSHSDSTQGSTSGSTSGTDSESADANDTGDSGNGASVAASLEEITKGIESDMTAASDAINAKKTEAEGKLGDSIDSYKANASALTDWYDYVSSESRSLYSKVTDNSVKYFEALAQKATADKYLDADALLDEYYKTVYEDAFEDYYDDIYDTAYEDMYDKYYNGVLDDKPESMSYDEWSDLRSSAYKEWSDSKSDFYSEWSDMKSAVYTLYSDVNSDIWNDSYDFSKAIERFQKKTAQFKQQ